MFELIREVLGKGFGADGLAESPAGCGIHRAWI